MLIAKGENGERVSATRGGVARCPVCDETLTPKCGDLVAWHWAHRADSECSSAGESDWHIGMKMRFADLLGGQVESVVGGVARRADVLAVRPDGGWLVVEVQRSSITAADVHARTADWAGAGAVVVWVWDAREWKWPPCNYGGNLVYHPNEMRGLAGTGSFGVASQARTLVESEFAERCVYRGAPSAGPLSRVSQRPGVHFADTGCGEMIIGAVRDTGAVWAPVDLVGERGAVCATLIALHEVNLSISAAEERPPALLDAAEAYASAVAAARAREDAAAAAVRDAREALAAAQGRLDAARRETRLVGPAGYCGSEYHRGGPEWREMDRLERLHKASLRRAHAARRGVERLNRLSGLGDPLV